MFHLRSLGQYTDTEIIRKINDMGYRGHGRHSAGSRPTDNRRIKLATQQMWRMEKEIGDMPKSRNGSWGQKPADLKEIGTHLKHFFEHPDQAVKKTDESGQKGSAFQLTFQLSADLRGIESSNIRKRQITRCESALFTTGTPEWKDFEPLF